MQKSHLESPGGHPLFRGASARFRWSIVRRFGTWLYLLGRGLQDRSGLFQYSFRKTDDGIDHQKSNDPEQQHGQYKKSKTVKFERIIERISFNAWFMYCGALTLGALLKESGGALWLATTFLNALSQVGMDQGYGLWVGMSAFSGLVTNFMSDAATVALIGPIVVPMGIMTQVAGEPWAIGMAVALASSYAHFLIVGSPANALTFALGVYPNTNKRALEAIDFVKYGLRQHLATRHEEDPVSVKSIFDNGLVKDDVGLKAGVLASVPEIAYGSAGADRYDRSGYSPGQNGDPLR